MRHKILIALAIVLIAGAMAWGQDSGIPDTVYYGADGYAYGYPGGIVNIPIYFFTDVQLNGVQVGMEYGMDGYPLVFDSCGEFNTIFMEDNYLDLTGLICQQSTDGVNPDTMLSGGAAIFKPLPAGRYRFANIWFTGANVGDQITVDSAWAPPAGDFIFAPKQGSAYKPEFVGGILNVIAGPPEIVTILPDSVYGDAASLITFAVEAQATYPPVGITLDSVINTGTGEPLPYMPATSGVNPLTVEWTPTYDEYGVWRFWFTATDATDGSLPFSVLVTVNFVPPPCDVLRGDPNCDDIINVTDVVFLIQYIFNQGPEPGCPEDSL
jgi:hypothetical protein